MENLVYLDGVLKLSKFLKFSTPEFDDDCPVAFQSVGGTGDDPQHVLEGTMPLICVSSSCNRS